jgi:hypothetical protein
MTKNLVRRSVIASLIGVGLLVLSVPIAKLATTNNAAVLEACINSGNGMMRLVDSSTACHKNETRIEWNEEGPPGPEGPAGPEGPPGPSSSGPPYVWVCMPTHRKNFAGFQQADLYVFNSSGSVANIAVHMLDSTGTNLVGVAIPGAGGATYPGEAGAATFALAVANTRNLLWQIPLTGGGGPGVDGTTNVVFAVRVTSDQPIVVGSNFDAGGFLNSECSLAPK